MTVKDIIKFLKKDKITGEDKTLVVSALLENIDALPIKDIISFDKYGKLLINGRELDLEQSKNLLDSIRVLKDNQARKLLNQQILFEAIKNGVHQALTPEQIMFSKCAIWIIEQEEKLLANLISE